MSLSLEIIKFAQTIKDFDSKERKMLMKWAVRASYLESNAKHESMYFDGMDTKVWVRENKDTGYADVHIDTPRTHISCWMRTYGDMYRTENGHRYYDLVLVQNKVHQSNIFADVYGVDKKIPSINGLKSMSLRIVSTKGVKSDDLSEE